MKYFLHVLSLCLVMTGIFYVNAEEIQLRKEIKVTHVGKTMKTPEKLEITINSLRMAEVHELISFITPRREVFLEVELTITNKGKNEIKIDSINNFGLMDVYGNFMNGEFMLGGIRNTIAPKETLTSKIYFDVAKSSGYYLLFRHGDQVRNAFRINMSDITEVEAL